MEQVKNLLAQIELKKKLGITYNLSKEEVALITSV